MDRRDESSTRSCLLLVADTDCVVVRKSLFDRIQNLLNHKTTFDPTDAYPLVEATLADLDDEGLESYQPYKRRP